MLSSRGLLGRALLRRGAPALRLSALAPSWQQRAAAIQPYEQPRSVALDHGGGEASLAQLSERAGLLPRPEVFDEKLKPGFRGGKALLIFFLCNAIPFGSLLYYLREQRAQKAQLSLVALPMTADDVAAEVLRVTRTSAFSMLTLNADVGGTETGTVRVDPHPSEATAFVPSTEPLPLIPTMERNVVTDIFEDPPVSGLGFVHFAVSRASSTGAAVLAGNRQGSLLYVSHSRGAYCTVNGQLSILADTDSRRRYWKNLWAASFPPTEPVEEGKEPPDPWLNSDYLLLRFAVSEAMLHAVVDGPARWEGRKVRRLEGAAKGDGPKWGLVAPQAPAVPPKAKAKAKA